MKRATYECPFQNLLFEKKRKKIIIDKKQEEEKFREIDELLPIFLYFHEFLQQEQQPLQKKHKR